MNKKNKKQAMAVTLATSLLVGGTFAWQSYSQRVTNETAGVNGNVGARLHNDFNGTNADVYVENYADSDGTTVYTRARLHEYMEYGTGAGTHEDDARPSTGITLIRGDVPVDDTVGFTPDIEEPSTWDIYLHEGNQSSDLGIRDFMSLQYGDIENSNKGSKVYMPTFNKNFEDEAADIKGYLGDGGSRYNKEDSYTTYETYIVGQAETDDATYSELAEAVAGQGTNVLEETHYAQNTLTGSVISMDEWMDVDGYNCEPGNYWVFDTDGWAYWAGGLLPETATSLLVDSVLVSKPLAVDWHYGLHVEMEVATAEDLGDAYATDAVDQGMYADITTDGSYLLNTIANVNAMGGISMMSLDFGMDEDMSILVQNVITIDGVSFYVIDTTTITAVDEEGYSTGRVDAALLLATDSIGDYTYNAYGDVNWSASDMRNTVLSSWLASKPTLAASAVRVPVVTDGYYLNADNYVSTEEIDEVTYDKVFLLSQMEFLATYNLSGDAVSKIYYGNDCWLRSPSSSTTMRVLDSSTGTISTESNVTSTTAGVRPALWVTY